MIKMIIDKFKNLDKKVKIIMNNGLIFSFILCIISATLLLIYHVYALPIFYYSGIILFRTFLVFVSSFIIMGIGFDTIKKQIKI